MQARWQVSPLPLIPVPPAETLVTPWWGQVGSLDLPLCIWMKRITGGGGILQQRFNNALWCQEIRLPPTITLNKHKGLRGFLCSTVTQDFQCYSWVSPKLSRACSLALSLPPAATVHSGPWRGCRAPVQHSSRPSCPSALSCTTRKCSCFSVTTTTTFTLTSGNSHYIYLSFFCFLKICIISLERQIYRKKRQKEICWFTP